MNPTVRNIVLTVSAATALAGALVLALPSAPEVVIEEVQVARPAPVKKQARPVTSHQEAEAAHDEGEHEHHSHAHVDLSQPFDPSTANSAHAEPEGLSADDRDEWLVLLESTGDFREKRKAIAILGKPGELKGEVVEVFRDLLKREPNEKLKALLLTRLAQTGESTLVGEFESIALGDGSLFLKRRALLGLASFPRETAFVSILRLAEEGDWAVKERAVRLLGERFGEEPEVEALLASL